MAGLPLRSVLSGNTRDARVRFSPQPAIASVTGGGPQIPIAAAGSFVQAQVYGGGPALSRPEIVDQVLSPRGIPLDGLEGKWDLGGGPLQLGSVDPGNPLQIAIACNAIGYYSFATVGGTGAGYVVDLLAGYAIGDTAIHVDTGTGTIPTGAYVRFAGDSHTYIVATGAAGPGDSDIVLAAPGLRQTLADDVAMTVHTYNVFRAAPSEATRVQPWLTAQWNDAVVAIRNYAGMLFHGVDFGAVASAPLVMSAPFHAHGFSEWGDTVQVAGSGDTLPRLIGTMDDQVAAESVDADVYLMCVSASAKTFKAKKGLGAGVSVGYGGANTLLTAALGTPFALIDQYGETIGDPSDQAHAYFPTGATLTDASVFKIPRWRAPWSESLPTRRPISSVNMKFLVNLEQVTIPGGLQTSHNWSDVYAQADTPGAQGWICENNGEFGVVVTPTRRITDRLFQDAIRVGAYVSVVADAICDAYIGSTLRRFRFLRVYPRCLVTGTMFVTAPGGGEKQEVPVLVAKRPTTTFYYDGYPFTDHCTFLWETDLANLTGLAVS